MGNIVIDKIKSNHILFRIYKSSDKTNYFRGGYENKFYDDADFLRNKLYEKVKRF